MSCGSGGNFVTTRQAGTPIAPRQASLWPYATAVSRASMPWRAASFSMAATASGATLPVALATP